MVYNSCYQLLTGQVNQSTGRANCKAAGGRIALISSAEEKGAVIKYVQDHGMYATMAWVDGTDAVTEGIWLTESGDVMSYTEFSDEEPNGMEWENCIVVHALVIDWTCNTSPFVNDTLCEL